MFAAENQMTDARMEGGKKSVSQHSNIPEKRKAESP
jgi:hypothetical protein